MLTDLRYGIRNLGKSPAFAVVAIVTLAVGIGANTAIFSVVNGVLLQPLPFAEPARLVNVWTTTGQEPRSNHSAGDFIDIQRENRSLAALAGYRAGTFTVVAHSHEPVQLEGSYVTPDFFDVLRVPPSAGRVFSRAGDRVPGEKLVVLGDTAWQQLFSRSQAAVGARVRVDGEPHTVAGVLPPRTEYPEGSEIWILSGTEVPPSPINAGGEAAARDVRYFAAIGRLRDGLSLSQAQQDLDRVATAIQTRHPQTAAGRGIRIAPVYEEMVEDVRWGLVILQAAVGLVLLIACANVSSLLIARASSRQRELAIRAALGAGRRRLVRQLLTESLVLSLAGGLAGLLLGTWLVGVLVRVLPEAVPRAKQIALDPFVAAVTILTALVTGALFGVFPALQASRANASHAMKQSGDRGSSGRARGRSALVVAEMALTLVLLAGAGLLLNSFLRLRDVDSGMRPADVTVLGLALPPYRYADGPSQAALYGRLLEALAGRPEVQAAGVGFPGPLRGSNASGSFHIEGRSSVDQSDRPFANLGAVSGGFFPAMGIPLVAGRVFTESDGAKAAGVGIASMAMARKYWPGDNAVGKRLRFDDDPDTPWVTIVGLVGDVRQLGLEKAPPPILYIPYRQFPLPFTNVAVRSTSPPAAVAALLRAALKTVDADLPFGELTTLQAVLDRSIEQPRFRTTLLLAFASAALVLAAVGVYGLMSFAVTSRTREIGIRIALGAQPRQVVVPILREGLLLAAGGISVGLAGALLAVRLIGSFLFNVSAGDPLTFTAVALLLLVVALAASYIPSRRALRVDPISALRE